MSPESYNDHHILHPRKAYKTKVQKELRQSRFMVVNMPIAMHNELHASTPPPKRLHPQEMHDALRLLREMEELDVCQYDAVVQLATHLGRRSLEAKQVGQNMLHQATFFKKAS